MIMNKKTRTFNILFIILFIYCSISFFFGVFSLIGFITNKGNFLAFLPMFIVNVLPMAYLFGGFKEIFVKKFSKTGYLIFISILTLLSLICLVLIVINANFYFDNSANQLISILTIINIIFLIGFGIYLFTAVLFKVKQFADKPIELGNPYNFHKSKMICFGTYSLFASYFLVIGLISIFLFNNYIINPFLYIIGILVCLLPMVNLVSMVIGIEGKAKYIFSGISGIVSLLALLGFVLFFLLDFYELDECLQHILLLDTATSLPISVIIFAILLIAPQIYNGILYLKKHYKK